MKHKKYKQTKKEKEIWFLLNIIGGRQHVTIIYKNVSLHEN